MKPVHNNNFQSTLGLSVQSGAPTVTQSSAAAPRSPQVILEQSQAVPLQQRSAEDIKKECERLIKDIETRLTSPQTQKLFEVGQNIISKARECRASRTTLKAEYTEELIKWLSNFKRNILEYLQAKCHKIAFNSISSPEYSYAYDLFMQAEDIASCWIYDFQPIAITIKNSQEEEPSESDKRILWAIQDRRNSGRTKDLIANINQQIAEISAHENSLFNLMAKNSSDEKNKEIADTVKKLETNVAALEPLLSNFQTNIVNDGQRKLLGMHINTSAYREAVRLVRDNYKTDAEYSCVLKQAQWIIKMNSTQEASSRLAYATNLASSLYSYIW